MNYTWASATHPGLVRDGNEDALSPSDDGTGRGPLVVAVADGMGGHVAGEIASRIAIDAAVDGASAAMDAVARVEAGNDAVLSATQSEPELAGMGTTMTLAILDERGRMQIGHVGDSRLYLFRDDQLQLLTNDHTWVGELVARGQLTPEAAATHPRRHMLTRVLGTSPVVVDETTLDLEKGDRILVCSDGLTSMLGDQRIAAIIRGAESVSDAAWALVEAANFEGGIDNTSVVVVDVGA